MGSTAEVWRWLLLLLSPLLSQLTLSPGSAAVTRPGHSVKCAVGVADRQFEARAEISIGAMPDLYLPDVSKLTGTLSAR